MGRLFWKLFTAYWLAFVVIIVAGFVGLVPVPPASDSRAV